MAKYPQGGVYMTAGGVEVPWSSRVSARARHASVRVSPKNGVVVVLPKRSRVNPETLLRQNDAWVERAFKKAANDIDAYNASRGVPRQLDFRVCGDVWQVSLHATNSKSVSARADYDLGVVRLSGAVGDEELVLRALRRFVSLSAKDVLVELLERVSEDVGIGYSRVRISSAVTRWGSCSSKGVISLSSRLMFLPQPLAIHVCMHELAHTVCFDHGREFHALLKALDPSCDSHVKALKGANALVPAWMSK